MARPALRYPEISIELELHADKISTCKTNKELFPTLRNHGVSVICFGEFRCGIVLFKNIQDRPFELSVVGAYWWTCRLTRPFRTTAIATGRREESFGFTIA